MTSTEPDRDDLTARHGYHVTWCTNQGDDFPMHSVAEPYCSHNVAGFAIVAEGEDVKRQGWVSATRPFNHGTFTAGELETRDRLYEGIEISIETWRGPGTEWDDQRIRITSDVARSLAAALVRAADIEQGLTR